MATTYYSQKPNHASRFTRLALESLETRDCPATIALNSVVALNGLVSISGQLTDAPNEAVEIQFSGSAYGSTFTNSDGTFSLVTDQATIGTLYAVGVDQGVEVTNTVNAQIDSNPPVLLMFEPRNEFDHFWTFSGRIQDEYVEGMTVYFGGVAEGQYVTVGADGNFSVTLYIPEEEAASAFVTAVTTDWWGLQSAVAERYLN